MQTTYTVNNNSDEYAKTILAVPRKEPSIYNAIVSNRESSELNVNWDDKILVNTETVIIGDYIAGNPTIVVQSANGIYIGSVIYMGDLAYLVTDISGTTLTIQALGSDADYGDGDPLLVGGRYATEGQDFREDLNTTTAPRTNPFGRLDAGLVISDEKINTANRSYEEGVLDFVQEQAMDKTEDIKAKINKSIWNNFLYDSPNNTLPNIPGGIPYFIAQYGTNTSGAFSTTNIDAWLLSIKQKFGRFPKTLWVNSTVYGKFNALNSEIVRVAYGENKVGSTEVTTYVSSIGGSLEILTDEDIATDKIHAFDLEQVAWIPKKNMALRVVPMGKTGANEKWLIDATGSLEFKNAQTCGTFTITG